VGAQCETFANVFVRLSQLSFLFSFARHVELFKPRGASIFVFVLRSEIFVNQIGGSSDLNSTAMYFLRLCIVFRVAASQWAVRCSVFVFLHLLRRRAHDNGASVRCAI